MAPPATDTPQKLSVRVRVALLDCFDPDGLRMLVGDHLDVKLEWVTPNRNFEVVVFELIEWAEREGQLLHLLTAAAARVPGKPVLADLRDECAGSTAGRPAVDPAAVRDAVIRFNERFTDRRKRLAVLQANKGLHDILHQLQRTQPELERLMAAAAAPGFNPLDAEDLVDTLNKWVQQADSFVPPVASDRRRKWVTTFAGAVAVVTARLNGGPAAPGLDRAVALLAHLPADQQADLNERLLETAGQLDAVSLGEPLDRLQRALAADDAAELLDRFVAFQADCGRMKRLTDQHEWCQLVDGALREADGLPQPTAGTLAQWAETAGWLDQLAAARPTDAAAARVVQTARRFAAADPAAAGGLLGAVRERFGNLFFNIDAELLDATDQVLHAAEVLDALLRRFVK